MNAAFAGVPLRTVSMTSIIIVRTRGWVWIMGKEEKPKKEEKKKPAKTQKEKKAAKAEKKKNK